MIDLLLLLLYLFWVVCVAVGGYVIGHDVGYSKGRRDGWMQYDSIVPDIKDEVEKLFGEKR